MSQTGGTKSGILGEVAKPPFAVVPDPAWLFLNRSNRLAALAGGHELQPYLEFLARLTRGQHEIQAALPPAALPSSERMSRALEHGMPPISRALFAPDDVVQITLDRLVGHLVGAEVPPAAAHAAEALRSAPWDERHRMATAVLEDVVPMDDLARHGLVAAGLQVHFTRLAALLTADDLKPVADGACPVCGSPPMTSAIVGWPNAHNSRFCACSLCGTMWNVLRVKCVLCGCTDGITYRMIENRPDTVKAETCETCRSYVKVLYQVKNDALDPLADDVATLGLDMLMAKDGWKRGGQNPFLLGY